MALDGIFLSCLRRELQERLTDTRVEKVYQPGRDELIFSMHGRSGDHKLVFSAVANAARVHITDQVPENPAQPPMFCMLLRKRLTGGRLAAIRQPGLERVLSLDFDCVSELGDPVRLTLVLELIGTFSNAILIAPDGKIIDALRRIYPDTCPNRPIVPGFPYEAPVVDARRADWQAVDPDTVVQTIRANGGDCLSKALAAGLQGVSPLTGRELAFRVTGGDPAVALVTEPQWRAFAAQLERLRTLVRDGDGCVPFLLTHPDGRLWEYSFEPLAQYGLDARGRELPSFSALLDEFYAERAAAERLRSRAHDLTRTVDTLLKRTRRKLDRQREELSASGDRETLHLYADLILGGIGQIAPGADSAALINYYDETCPTVTVPLDPTLSAAANAQKYYKEYRKAQTAEEMLTARIAAGEAELVYLESVQDALSRAVSTRELDELRRELENQGYLRLPKTKQKAPALLGPLKFRTDDGFTVLIGRNNTGNDQLTLRIAQKHDIWFHTKDIPGSHTVVVTEGQTPPDRTLEQAAILAATHSRASGSVQVPVDYTAIRYVKKPSGAKPGLVIYTDNRTAFVDPDPQLAKRLQIED